LDALELERVNWCGLSMGGMVGQWLGANAPQRVERLVITNTSSYFVDKTSWNERLRLVREKGIAAFAGPNMARWFTKEFRELLPRIRAPTLVIAGKHDPATPLEANQYLASRIPGAKLVVLDAAHLSNIEQPDAYAGAVLRFLVGGHGER